VCNLHIATCWRPRPALRSGSFPESLNMPSLAALTCTFSYAVFLSGVSPRDLKPPSALRGPRAGAEVLAYPKVVDAFDYGDGRLSGRWGVF
jgi:hypothetical protein